MKRIIIISFLLLVFNSHIYPQSSLNYSDIFFLDDQNGWILSTDGYLWKTTNAGNNWISIFDPQIFGAGKITFIDEQNGWLLIRADLYYSSNGGNNWNYKYTFPLFGAPYDIAFVNNSVGFVSFFDNLYKSSDRGSTWTWYDTSSPINIINKISVYGENLIFISSGFSFMSYVYKSTDKGETWSLSNEFGSVDGSGFGKVQMFNETDGILNLWYSDFVAISELLKTTDAGESWDQLGNGFKFKFGLTDFEFSSPQLGWVTTQNKSIFRTTNRGIT